jgi:hypothetical protein
MVLRNRSRRLARANFSKLGWQANVIWRIAIYSYIPFDADRMQVDHLIRGSLDHVVGIGTRDLSIGDYLKD